MTNKNKKRTLFSINDDFKINRYNSGFTIVELLVVIVVVGILAAIVIVSYTGISQKAIDTSSISDLLGANTTLDLYKIENESYPTSLDINNCPLTPKTDDNYCLKKALTN